MTVSTYFQPASVPEALALLGEHGPDLLVIAGGTVAMPLINEGISLPRLVMGLRRTGLDGIEHTDDTLRIGAMTTLTTLADQEDSPLLATAARRTASWAVRNMATVGGNLFTPPPGGDVATALLALDAQVELTGVHGGRTIPIEAFWTGFLGTALGADELVTGITVRLGAGDEHRDTFLKFGRKAANTPAVVTVAAHVTVEGGTVREARIALGAVGPHPVRARAAEAALAGQPLTAETIATAAAAATDDTDPFTDAVATDWYRRRMVRVIVERALTGLAAQAGRDA
ncbi:MAG TPA: FAD binding domain-containing protein [Candidatus Limnocylindrales bacterium]